MQECISNVLKHAQATRIEVAVLSDHRAVKVQIADDGTGFQVTQQLRLGMGRGLKNLQSRAQQLGATIEIDSSAAGTIVRLSLPLERSAAGGKHVP